MGGCFSAMRMGCFLIFVAPKDYWMLGLCTSHAFFSLLNILCTLMGVVCGHLVVVVLWAYA